MADSGGTRSKIRSVFCSMLAVGEPCVGFGPATSSLYRWHLLKAREFDRGEIAGSIVRIQGARIPGHDSQTALPCTLGQDDDRICSGLVGQRKYFQPGGIEIGIARDNDEPCIDVRSNQLSGLIARFATFQQCFRFKRHCTRCVLGSMRTQPPTAKSSVVTLPGWVGFTKPQCSNRFDGACQCAGRRPDTFGTVAAADSRSHW